MNRLTPRTVLLALACALSPGITPAAALNWVPGSQGIVRGQVFDTDLRISGLANDSAWVYSVNVSYDPSIIQLVGYAWGDGAGGDQLSCPGPTPQSCTHVGSVIQTDVASTLPSGSHWFFEATNGEHWTPGLDAIQLDDFAILHLRFVGVESGSTGLTAEGDYGASAWAGPATHLSASTAQIDVQLPEPASWLLGLCGLAAVRSCRRKRADSGP